MIDLETLLRLPSVNSAYSFDLAPDGTKVAYSWNPDGQWEIYELFLDGSGRSKALSSGPGSKFAPHYSPDGGRLAYLVDFDGGENFHLFVHDLASGQAQDLTPDITSTLQPSIAWSPGGSQFAILDDRSGCFDLYCLPAQGGEPRLLFGNGRPAEKVTWSPDGRWLAVTVLMAGQDSAIFLVPAEGGEAFPLKNSQGVLNAHHPAWSPDGGRLAFSSDANGTYDIGIYEIATGEIAWLGSGEADKDQPAWSADGTRLVYICSQGATTWLEWGAPGQDFQRCQVEAGLHSFPHFNQAGDEIMVLFDNPSHPPDLWELPLDGGKPRQLTQSLPRDLQEVEFPQPVEIRYAGLDGKDVPALLWQPANASAHHPALVVIHGGPNWLFQISWMPFMTHLASRGWTVLAPNYRGSTGYGRDWQMASRFDLGGVDTQDVVAGARFLAQAGLADPSRIAVTGRSHGGYLTMTCLTQYPELWAGGSAVVPFLNWFASHVNSRQDLQDWDLENFGDPVKDYQRWYDRSPFFFLDRVSCPVQLICGANDPRCPAAESIAARDRLRELGKPVDFLLYEDEGHSFLSTDNVVDAELSRVEFLARCLG